MTTTLDPSLTDDSSYPRTRVEADNDGSWPPAPTIVTHILGGALAERVRRRLGAGSGEEVRLVETTTYGGYSEWTQENSTEFDIECFGRTVTFHPKSSTADWRQDMRHSFESVFARFDAWLAAAEWTSVLFAEWFEHEAEAGQVVRFRARPDTILTGTASHRHHGIDHISLTGTGDHGTGRSWTLDLVAAADSTGFQRIIKRHHLDYVFGMTISDDVARAILYDITDQLMPGFESW